MALRDEAGFLLLMLGLMLTVGAYGFSFILSQSTDFCIVDGVLDSINKTKLEKCISNTLDFNVITYYIGFAGIIVLAIATVLFSNVSFKKSR